MFRTWSWLLIAHRSVVVLVFILMVVAVSRLDAHPASARSPDGKRQDEPIVTNVIPIKYRDATELATILRQHLEVRGCAVITADPHTNALIITGTQSCLRFQDEQESSRGADRPPTAR